MQKVTTVILALIVLATPAFAVDVPHENREFLEGLSNSMQAIEDDFASNETQSTRSGKLLQSLLKNFVKEKIVKKEQVLTSLDKFQGLKKKLLKSKKKNNKGKAKDGDENITVADLYTMTKSDFDGIPEGEKEGVRNQAIALLLAELKQPGKSDVDLKDKLKEVILDYLKSAEKLEPNKAVPLTDTLKKMLGLNNQSKSEDLLPENLIKRIKQNGIPSEKAGLDFLSSLVGNSLNNVESLNSAFEPIYNTLYKSKIEITPNQLAIPNGGFQSALDMIGSIRNEPRTGIAPPPADFNGGLNLTPIQRHRNTPSSGSVGGGGISGRSSSGGNRFNGNGNSGGGSFSGPAGRIPAIQDTEELKACLDSTKQKRFNVELKLPGALCASTAVSARPQDDQTSYDALITQGGANAKCTVKLATAVHCIEGMQLQGKRIGLRIAGRNVSAEVLNSGSVDGSRGQAVANGNPDLAMIIASIPCADAKNVNIARVPTPDELQEMMGRDSVPLIMQQNSEINASIGGRNAATIAGQGTFERYTDGRVGNFLRFNSNSMFNASGAGDSSRIRQGDSGGTALTCKMSGTEVRDHLYLGAISHIDVLGNQYEGTIGGIASGQSLANLSNRIHGTAPGARSGNPLVTNTSRNNTDSLAALGNQGIRQQPASSHLLQ